MLNMIWKNIEIQSSENYFMTETSVSSFIELLEVLSIEICISIH